MALTYIRNLITSGYNVTKINDNFQKILDGITAGLSRTSASNNQMNVDLDMNGHDVMNVGALDATNFTFEGLNFQELIDDAEAAAIASQGSATASAASASAASTSATNANNSAIAAAASAASAAATVQPALAAAPNKASPTDTDRISIIDAAASFALKYITIPNLIAAIFNGTRDVANGWFTGATFRLRNAATAFYLNWNVSSLTASRLVTFPDADVDLGAVIGGETTVTLTGTAFDVTGIPTGIGRVVIALDMSWTTATIGTLQLGSSAGVVTSGYTSQAATINSANTIAAATGAAILVGSAAAVTIRPTVTIVRKSGNQWQIIGQGSLDASGVSVLFSSMVTLPGVLDRVRFSTQGAGVLTGSATVRWSKV